MSYRNWWGCTFLGACYKSIRSVNKGIMRFILSPVCSWGKSGKVLIIKFENYFFQPTWCYSKYIEALEQERILLKIQEEMEKKMFTGNFCLSCTELLCCRLAQTNFRSLHRPLRCLSPLLSLCRSSFTNLLKLPTSPAMSLKKNLSLLSSCSLSAFLSIQNQRHCLSPATSSSPSS